MQISHPGSLTLEPTLLPYKGLLFMHFSGFSLRSFPHEMSCELGFSCGVAPALTETGSTLTGSMAQNKSCLNQRREKCYSAKPFPLWHPWCISNKNQEPTSHPSPIKRCLQFLIPVIEDMCYSANSTDGKWLMIPPLWSLANEREEEEWERRRLSIFIFLC